MTILTDDGQADRTGQLLTELLAFIDQREVELKLPLGTGPDVLIAALVSHICTVAMIKPDAWDDASRECTLRIGDVIFSMKDWAARRMPWRWQSMEMRERAEQAVAQMKTVGRSNGRMDS